MFEIKNMPLLPGQNQGRVVTQVNKEELNTIGVQGGAFTMHKGDIIEFDNDDPLVVSQKVRDEDNSPLAYYVAVTRNGKPSWLSIGILTRRNAKGEPIGEFQAKMCEKASFAEIYDELRGKKIVGGELKNHEFAVFDGGVRTDRVQNRAVPEIHYA